MVWKGTACPLSQGWQERFLSKTFAAAGIGSVAGAVLAMLERKPVIPHMAGTAASAAICLSVYGVLLEGVRILRCHDSPVNSVVAAGAASYILVSSHSGRHKAVPAALYCALGAGGVHFLNQTLHWDQALRWTLVRMDLLDDEAIRAELAQPPEIFRPVSAAELGWKKYLPIRKMTTEEHERHLGRKAKREENSMANLALARSGRQHQDEDRERKRD
ncbi:g747 [Coccomyxa viridis]|uniref:G747 protein n=1 Tax=Coccomyxa viridis TaxID=1274662 RepID=A0ABP1FLU1_9CHLO